MALWLALGAVHAPGDATHGTTHANDKWWRYPRAARPKYLPIFSIPPKFGFPERIGMYHVSQNGVLACWKADDRGGGLSTEDTEDTEGTEGILPIFSIIPKFGFPERIGM